LVPGTFFLARGSLTLLFSYKKPFFFHITRDFFEFAKSKVDKTVAEGTSFTTQHTTTTTTRAETKVNGRACGNRD